jgi:hypothetical protein
MTRNIRKTCLMLTVLAFLLFPEPGKTDVEGRACDSEQTNMLVEYGDLTTCSINPIGDVDVFQFKGSAGEVIIVRLNPQSGGGSPCLTLDDPDENLLARNCPLGIVALTVRLPKTGAYTIQVAVWNHATMIYSLSLERMAPPSPSAMLIEYGDLITCSIDPIGDVDVFQFKGSAEEVVLARLNPQSGGSPCLALFDPDGSLIGSNCPLGIAGLNVRLPKTGTYTIQITVWNQATMTYSIGLQCAGSCAALPSPTVNTFNAEGTGQHLYDNGESLKHCPSLPSPTVKIFGVEVIGKHLYVNGENFKDGAQVELNGNTIKTSNEEDFSRRLKCKKAGKKVQRGQTVLLLVRNPDGTKSQPFLYARPA